MKHIFIRFALVALAALPFAFLVPSIVSADTIGPIDFENPTYTTGIINGQNGWSATGSAGSGCAVYDEGVVANTSDGAPVSFAGQSFRISNAVTSGCFGDQAFSVPLVNAAGETGADAGTFSAGTLQSHFESQFDIFPISQSIGDILSVSPDRGDGARMSYLRFENQADGVHVYFDDVTDPTHATNADTFNESQIALLDPSVSHRIKFSIDFYDGPDNDVVNIYIDGSLVHTGTTWEDYYLYDTESNPGLTNEHSRIVRTMLFRAGGTAVPENADKGFLIDNLSLSSGPIPPPPPTPSVTTNSATGETLSGAIVHGTDGPINADNTSFWWGTGAPGGTLIPGADPASFELPAGWTHDSGIGAVSSNGAFSESLSGLTAGQTYYFVAWVQSGGIWYPGQVLSFVVPAAAACPSGTQVATTPLETISVNSNMATPTASSNSLLSGKSYLLVSSGTWQNNSINVADTAFASLDNWTTYQEGYDSDPYFLGPNEFNLEINNAFINWGAYDGANHTYSYLYTGNGSPANFMVFDGNSNNGPSAINSSWYGDNTGSLSVKVYPCNPLPPPVPVNACATPTVAPAGYTLVTSSRKNNVINLVANTMYVGLGGNDVVTAGNGNHIICTGAGNDVINVGSGINVINAGGGNNTVTVKGGDSYVTTGSGNDTITTGNGNDTINAGDGNNVVSSGAGNDMITTGSGNDTINGGSGTNTCHAGSGHNTVTNCQ